LAKARKAKFTKFN